MGVAELRSAFNSVSEPAFTCTQAFLTYDRAHDTEWQILHFRGTAASGDQFEIKSDPLRKQTDLNQTAKEAAQKLLDQEKPTP